MDLVRNDSNQEQCRAIFQQVDVPSGPLTAAERDFTLSVVIPVRDELYAIERTIISLRDNFNDAGLPLEIIVVDDHSQDGTSALIERLSAEIAECRAIAAGSYNGFGTAVRAGLAEATGDGVAVVMGDGSDEPADAVSYSRLLAQGWDCVFGSRFIAKGSMACYPPVRLLINRLGNWWLRRSAGVPYNDMTNAFKAYRKEVLARILPLQSEDFSLTVEMPLKTLAIGCRHAVIPIRWYGRRSGRSKWRLMSQCASYLRTSWRITQ